MTQYHLILTIALWDKDNYSFYRWGNWPSEGLNYLQSKQFEGRILPYSSFHLKGLEHGRHSALLFQGFSKHGPQTSSRPISWTLVRNAILTPTLDLEHLILGRAQQYLCSKSSGNSHAHKNFPSNENINQDNSIFFKFSTAGVSNISQTLLCKKKKKNDTISLKSN